MDGPKESNLDEFSWKKGALKQGYLVKFQRGILKAPKMQYCVLTANGLLTFEGKPNRFTRPLSFLPYERLSSIKLAKMDANSSKLAGMQLTSKSNASFTLGFYRKEERDEWMCCMMEAFSQALLSTRVFDRSSKCWEDLKSGGGGGELGFISSAKEKLERKFSGNSASKESSERAKSSWLGRYSSTSSSSSEQYERFSSAYDGGVFAEDERSACEGRDRFDESLAGRAAHDVSTKELAERKSSSGSSSSYAQSLRRKRRKGEKGSIRKSKSYDSLALHDVTNGRCGGGGSRVPPRHSCHGPLKDIQEQSVLFSETRKRKSVPNIYVLSHFPADWVTEDRHMMFSNPSDFEHRDSLKIHAERQEKKKPDAKSKTTMFSKLRSRFEHTTKYVH